MIVETEAGKVRGEPKRGILRFRGIPYAMPPVGSLRWQPPVPHEAWSGVRDAVKPGPAAPQNSSALNAMLGRDISRQSEDCLFVDVWTPAADDARRPVMVWIHGGAFAIGTGSTPIYSGHGLLERDVVLVTMNYRLGALGFLRLADVSGDRTGASGNEGLLDQQRALAWVRDNIERFGGDPTNVTIFGESAGAMSVGAHLGMERSRNLFHKAILQSGACHTVRSKERASFIGERFARAMGSADNLVDAPVGALLETQRALVEGRLEGLPLREVGMAFQPNLDGEHLTERPLVRVKEGRLGSLPLLVGTTLDEWRLFGALDPKIQGLDEPRMKKRLGFLVGSEAVDGLVEAYRSALGERGVKATAPNIFMAIQTDRIFRIPAVRLLEAAGGAGGTAYSFLFDWRSPFAGGAFGAGHAVELGFVFGTHSVEPASQFFGAGDAAERLAASMMDAWTTFARTANPGWAPYDQQSRTTRMFGETVRTEEAPHDAVRAAWDRISDDVLGSL